MTIYAVVNGDLGLRVLKSKGLMSIVNHGDSMTASMDKWDQ